MASDTSVSAQRENQTQQLVDMRNEHERKMQRMRETYQKREVETRDAGEAAVNHIRASTEERVDRAQQESNRKLQATSEHETRNYNDLKRRIQINNESLDNQAREAEARASHRIGKASQEEARIIEEHNAKLRDFIERQRELKDQAREQATQDVVQVRERANRQVQQIKSKNQEQIQDTERQSQERLETLKEAKRRQYDETKAQADRRVEEARRDGDVKVANDRDQKNKSLRNTDIKYKEEIKDEVEAGEKRLAQMRKNETKKIEDMRERDLELNERTHDQYAKEAQRIQVSGETDIKDRQDRFDKIKHKQEEQNKAELKAQHDELLKKENLQRQEVENRMQDEASKLDKEIKNMRQEFKTRFDQSDKTYKSSLQNQKESYLKALYKQQQKYDTKFNREASRAEDPFYRLKTFDADLREHPGSYELKARVAPYEKDTVNIVVKDDKITVSARRQFEDSFTNEFGDRTTTNSYQTHRQDFQLDIPVDGSKAIKKIADDGSITVIAPKKGYPQRS